MTQLYMHEPDDLMQAKIVHMILNRKTEEALAMLSNFYHIDVPKIAVGTIKGKRRTVYAVYVRKEKKIYAINSDIFYNPFVILHEFYHHLRSKSDIHRGSEKHANMYAQVFVNSYEKIAVSLKCDKSS
ncbi:MAG TPA: hypothetical protein VI033_08545 [Candidatus Nitrosopolaris sp.]|jgi:hypothetical protein